MNSQLPHNPHHTDPTPDDLRSIDRALADLAAADRASITAPPGFHDRLVAATLPALTHAAANSAPAPIARITPVARWWPALAAAAVLALTFLGVFIAMRPASTSTPPVADASHDSAVELAALERDIESLLLSTSLFESTVSDELDTLAADADGVQSSISSPLPTAVDPSASQQGAM